MFKFDDSTDKELNSMCAIKCPYADIAAHFGNGCTVEDVSLRVKLLRQRRKSARLEAVEHGRMRIVLGAKHDGIIPDENTPVPEGYIRLMDAVSKTCRWPHWDNPHFCCAADRVPGRSYCADHVVKSMSAHKDRAGHENAEPPEGN